MSITPRNPKELVKLLSNDNQLRIDLRVLLHDTEKELESRVLDILREALRRGDISLALLDHADVTVGLKRYYRDIKLAGEMIKFW